MIINVQKEIYEGWTVGDFIADLEPLCDLIMSGGAIEKPFRTRAELADWTKSNQPYYKKVIPEVVEYFAAKYNL